MKNFRPQAPQWGAAVFWLEPMSADVYLFAADVLLLTHVLFVLFVVFGLVLIYVGNVCRWSWVRNPWFRLCHLLAIGIVVLQSWVGVICPLTVWETALRKKGGGEAYSGTFIGHWLEKLLYWQFPPWVFVVIYTLFGAAVLGSWFWVRPRSFGREKKE